MVVVYPLVAPLILLGENMNLLIVYMTIMYVYSSLALTNQIAVYNIIYYK